MKTVTDHHALRYLDAAQVVHSNGTLAGAEICTDTDKTLGSIGGVLVEPARRRVRYFVVERSALLTTRRYLVPADGLATLDLDGTIHVDANDDDVQRFDPASVARFSDADLIDAIFSPPAA